MKKLDELYDEISKAIEKLDFSKFWEGFKPLKFALYNDTECYFNGEYIEKTDEFVANHAIMYKGERIAIWKAEEEMDISVFSSKIVHEMFHGFQHDNNWDCWANDWEALFKYEYNEENLAIKMRENQLLLDMVETFDAEKYKELLKLRKYRDERFSYQHAYECGVEETEGSATYVEWQVLKQLDEEKAQEFVEKMRRKILNPEGFFPIRIPCYDIGALMINAEVLAGEYYYSADKRPVIKELIKDIPSVETIDTIEKDVTEKVTKTCEDFYAESKRIVDSAVNNNEVVLVGPYQIWGVNIWDARYYRGYITSTYFMSYTDNGEEKILHGNFVIKMKDDNETIEKAYKWI